MLILAPMEQRPLTPIARWHQNTIPVSSRPRAWDSARPYVPKASPGVMLLAVTAENSARAKKRLYCQVGVTVIDQALLPGPYNRLGASSSALPLVVMNSARAPMLQLLSIA